MAHQTPPTPGDASWLQQGGAKEACGPSTGILKMDLHPQLKGFRKMSF